MQRFNPDLVWLNGPVPMRLIPALGRRAVLVPYLHDFLHAPPRPWRIRGVWERIPVVLCASEAVARAAAEVGAPEDRLRVVWEPVERAQAAPEPDWAHASPVVGFVGRIEPRKGVLDLISAFRLLLERHADARLVVVGAAELDAPADYVTAVERALDELGDHAVRLGRVENATALMSWFDVLAVPSVEEPFGTVAAEALAAGTPVVATRSGGMEEYVRPGVDGELVPIGDPAALAVALEAVLARPRPTPSGERFAPELVADAVAAAFREALA
jgi:glycosyltransferase involved in cell wall biosynthesis